MGTGPPPNRPFVYTLFACFLSLRFLLLFIDPFPFYPGDHLFFPYLSVPVLCNCLFHLFRVIFLPPGHGYFFQDFLAVPRVEFVPFLPLFPPQMLYCNFLNYISNKWLKRLDQCVFSNASNIDDHRRDFLLSFFLLFPWRNNSLRGLGI